MKIGNDMKKTSKLFFEEVKLNFVLHNFEKAYHSFNTFYNLFRAKQHSQEEKELYREELEEMLVATISITESVLESEKDYELCEKMSSITKNIIKILEREL